MKEGVDKWKMSFVIFYVLILVFVVFIYTPSFLGFSLDLGAKELLLSLRNLIFLIVTVLPVAILLGLLSFKPKLLNSKRFLFLLPYITIVSIVEELIFRGFIQDRIIYFIHNSFYGVIVSALIFGLFHLPNGAKGKNYRLWNWKFVIITFIGGFFFGLTYLETNNIVYPIIIHFLSLIIMLPFWKKK